MVMEYVEGNCELESMYWEMPECAPWCHKMYGSDSESSAEAGGEGGGACGEGGGAAEPGSAGVANLHEAGREHLRQMGRVIAFDCLIFNWDRLPCVWGNNGNPGNVMFNKQNNLGTLLVGHRTAQRQPTLPNTSQYLSTPPNTSQYLATPPNTSQHLPTPPNTAQHLPTPPNICQQDVLTAVACTSGSI